MGLTVDGSSRCVRDLALWHGLHDCHVGGPVCAEAVRATRSYACGQGEARQHLACGAQRSFPAPHLTYMRLCSTVCREGFARTGCRGRVTRLQQCGCNRVRSIVTARDRFVGGHWPVACDWTARRLLDIWSAKWKWTAVVLCHHWRRLWHGWCWRACDVPPPCLASIAIEVCSGPYACFLPGRVRQGSALADARLHDGCTRYAPMHPGRTGRARLLHSAIHLWFQTISAC